MDGIAAYFVANPMFPIPMRGNEVMVLAFAAWRLGGSRSP